MLEIRILTGARAGQVDRFEKSVIVVGRHELVDLRFSPQRDLDVSGRHAEIRESEGRYAVIDTGSTNGTFVNGTKVAGTVELHDGDKVQFGAKGPEVEVHTGVQATPTHTRQKQARSTEERIAVAVSRETAGLKRYMIAALVLLAAGAGTAYYVGRRESTKRVEELRQLLARNDSMRVILAGTMATAGDTALTNEIQRKITALQRRLPGATSDAERQQIKSEIELNQRQLQRMVQMDLPAIHAANAPAVVLLVSEIDGKSFAGSGFSIDSKGLILTNRHNVENGNGSKATRIAVKFTNTKEWLPAKIVKVSDVQTEDLALIEMERGGPFPVVQGVSSGKSDAAEGMSVVTIGFPLGYDTPMEGEGGSDFIAKSTLNPGTVSKRTSSVLQIDSYAAHGSSGSPVFSTRGLVVGVVWGGPPEGGGRIVYAVPPDRIVEFLPAEAKGIVRE
jgi:S1-C subfamily serine protease